MHNPADLIISVLDEEKNEKAQYFSYYSLFKTRLPLLATPYENIKENDKEFKRICLKCKISTADLLLEYIYLDKIELEKYDFETLFNAIGLFIMYNCTKISLYIIRYLAQSINKNNCLGIAEKIYNIFLMTDNNSNLDKNLKDACQNFYYCLVKFISTLYDFFTVFFMCIFS